jgi:hypothetical protein
MRNLDLGVCRFFFESGESFLELTELISFDLSVANISCISCLPVFVCFKFAMIHLLFNISKNFGWMFFA